jgi:diaminohydroxyphosphoribosylaminopyrimidine deaminase/5-amino-6-(5-phosphoribosylamino)uracil reductase
LVKTARQAPTWVVHGDAADPARLAALEALGVVTIAAPSEPSGRVPVPFVLEALGRRGITELLVEGGGTIHGAMLDARSADALACYIAPVVLGGVDAPMAFGGEGIASLDRAHRLRNTRVDWLDRDIKVTGEFADVYGDH